MSSVEPVPQELLDIIDRLNEGDRRIDDLERGMFRVFAELQINPERVSERDQGRTLQDIERHLNQRNPGWVSPEPAINEVQSVDETPTQEVGPTQATAENQNEGGVPIQEVGNDHTAGTGQEREQASADDTAQQVDTLVNERGAEANPKQKYSRMKSIEKFRINSRPVWDWKEVFPGQFVYLKYYRLWHALLVTGSDPVKSTICGIHYGLKGFLSHEVSEEDFKVNLQKNELWEVHVPEKLKRPNAEIVDTARKMIGEKKFNMLSRRSRHMVLDCVLKD